MVEKNNDWILEQCYHLCTYTPKERGRHHVFFCSIPSTNLTSIHCIDKDGNLRVPCEECFMQADNFFGATKELG